MRGGQNRSGRRSRVIRSASSLPPFVDPLVIARQQHVGNRAPLPFARPRVMGIFEQAALEALLLARFDLAHHAGDQPHAGVEHGERRDLAARQHVVADRHLDQPAAGDDALVDALETRADDDEPRPRRPFARLALGERRAARAHDQPRPLVVGLKRRVEARRQNVGAHHHARPAARRRVVDRAVAAEPVLADVARLERPKPARQRVAGEAEAERPGEHLGEQSEDRWRRTFGRFRGERRARPAHPASLSPLAGGATREAGYERQLRGRVAACLRSSTRRPPRRPAVVVRAVDDSPAASCRRRRNPGCRRQARLRSARRRRSPRLPPRPTAPGRRSCSPSPRAASACRARRRRARRTTASGSH